LQVGDIEIVRFKFGLLGRPFFRLPAGKLLEKSGSAGCAAKPLM
jgi:hypothetical protein